ncbi:hypothetical protein HDV57DRAFT_35819 [Trichoderma longibrachiatum]
MIRTAVMHVLLAKGVESLPGVALCSAEYVPKGAKPVTATVAAAVAVTDRQTAQHSTATNSGPCWGGGGGGAAVCDWNWQRQRKRQEDGASGGEMLARQIETVTDADGRLHEFAVLRRCFAGGKKGRKRATRRKGAT